MKAILRGHYGSDLDVVNAARVSFDKKSDWIVMDGKQCLSDKDERLINYLARGMRQSEWDSFVDKMYKGWTEGTSKKDVESLLTNFRLNPTHWVPFTHNYIKIEVNAPVPIRTQCFKHKFGFTESEESRRYISTEPVVYVPEFRQHAEDIKQGSGGVHPDNDFLQRFYSGVTSLAVDSYSYLLNQGVAEEQARFILPQGCEVHWIWSGNLASFARYYNQRADEHAQKESQELAEMIGNIIEPLFPVSWKALTRIK